MSVEMIAAIKAKRLAKIRATIKTDEDLGHGNVSKVSPSISYTFGLFIRIMVLWMMMFV